MALTPGTRLGPYEVTAQIGVGGMGEVYRATDTNLKRAVAIKVLPESVVADGERLARFQREAEVLASLNHPNIAQIHGLEKSAGTTALVMELVEGPTLADRIAQGAIPVDEALPIVKQIAEALEAAHEQGIIHRDLKPANIKVRPDGVVKVLDFGLAKALGDDVGGDLSNSPTLSLAATRAGVILGTAAYMSPEQAKGKRVDKRADIWAFGCVLYEMLTGERPFKGDDLTETLASLVKDQPDVSRAPPHVRRLLKKCLEKDPKKRLRDIGDAWELLGDETPRGAVSTGAHWRRALPWALAGVLALAALAVLTTLYFRRPVPEPVVTRLDVVTPPTSDAFSFALSPDGRQLAFVGSGEKGSGLWVRALDQVTALPLAGTEGASYPFWAPDGRALGFFADGKLKRIDLTGGALQVLADAPFPRGGTWNADGVIVFAPTILDPLLRVAATGGTAAPVTRLAVGQGSHRWPQFLPDGRRFLFLMATGQPHTQGVYVGSLDGGEPTRVMPAATAAVYAAPGYLLLVSQGVLAAYPFDAARAMVTREPIPVAQAVGTDDGTFHSAFSVSAQGVLAHRAGGGARRQLVWVDRTGKMLAAIGEPDENTLGNPELAPDGRRVAVCRGVQGNFDVWLVETGRGVPSRFTFDAAIENAPVWSPDGSRVVFRSSRKGVHDLFEKPASGTADEQPLLVTSQAKSPLDWSRDGRFLLYSTQDPKTGSDLWALPLTGERPSTRSTSSGSTVSLVEPSTGSGRPELAEGRKPFAVLQSSFEEIEGQFSPDGRWLAYASNESGRYEIYVRTFPEAAGKWQVSVAGGAHPRWRRDGHELFYVAPDTRLISVPIRLAADTHALEAGPPVPLFPTRLATGQNIAAAGFQARAQYSVAADGRFLLNIVANDAIPSPITIVQNWTVGLKK